MVSSHAPSDLLAFPCGLKNHTLSMICWPYTNHITAMLKENGLAQISNRIPTWKQPPKHCLLYKVLGFRCCGDCDVQLEQRVCTEGIIIEMSGWTWLLVQLLFLPLLPILLLTHVLVHLCFVVLVDVAKGLVKPRKAHNSGASSNGSLSTAATKKRSKAEMMDGRNLLGNNLRQSMQPFAGKEGRRASAERARISNCRSWKLENLRYTMCSPRGPETLTAYMVCGQWPVVWRLSGHLAPGKWATTLAVYCATLPHDCESPPLRNFRTERLEATG